MEIIDRLLTFWKYEKETIRTIAAVGSLIMQTIIVYHLLR